VAEPPSSTLLEGHPALDEVLVLPRPAWESALREAWSLFPALGDIAGFVGELRRRRFALTLDFQGTLKSGLLGRLSGAPLRLGYAGSFVRERAHHFYTHRVDLGDPALNRVLRNLRLVEDAPSDPGELELDMALGPEDRRRGREALMRAAGPGPGPVVLVVPGSSRRQSYKRYPPERYGEALGPLRRQGARIVVAGGPGEEELVAGVAAAIGKGTGVLPAVGLKGLAAALGEADLFVGGDTGPMHMAWAMGTPVVAIFGPTRTDWNAPLGDGHRVVAPAGGPNPRGERAFESVPAEAVRAAASELLSHTPRALRQGAPDEVGIC
jgi:ADP-heptose:LPS heptosyltransferase